MMSAAFSAIMMAGAFRLPSLTTLGMMEASTTLRFSTRAPLGLGSHFTAVGSEGWPILQVHEGW